MIKDLVCQCFFQRDNKSYFARRNNTERNYVIELFTNWIRQNHEKLLEQF